MFRKALIALAVCGLATGLAGLRILPSSAQPASGIVTPGGRVVAEGSVARLEHTMRDDAGAVLDASTEAGPLVFTQGEHQVIVGLERAVVGMGVGEEKRVTVAPEEAYGAVGPDALAEVPRGIIPPDAQSAGQQLVARSPDGSTRVVRVKEVREGTVLLDLNHPVDRLDLGDHHGTRVTGAPVATVADRGTRK